MKANVYQVDYTYDFTDKEGTCDVDGGDNVLAESGEIAVSKVKKRILRSKKNSNFCLDSVKKLLTVDCL